MTDPQPPSGLRAWGQSLWDQVTSEVTLDVAGYFILAEACRTADIVEKLSGALRSNNADWIRLSDEAQEMVGGDVVEINIVVNPILSEIRQQRLALRQLFAQLKLGSVSSGTSAGDDPIAAMMAEFSQMD